MMVPERPQRNLGIVDIAAVRREQPGAEEIVLAKKSGRANAVVLHHVVDLGMGLIEMDGVAQIVFLGEIADGMEQFGRRTLGESGRWKHADAAKFPVPGAEQIVDALHSLVPHLGRELGRFAPCE
jgi:hypothetical protein